MSSGSREEAVADGGVGCWDAGGFGEGEGVWRVNGRRAIGRSIGGGDLGGCRYKYW